jgi:filamentous hemagglutinin
MVLALRLTPPKTIPYEPKGAVILQGDAPVCGPSCAAMTITDKTGVKMTLSDAIKQFENGIRPTVSGPELSEVISKGGVKNTFETDLFPGELNRALDNGQTVIVNIRGHFIIVDGREVVGGVTYYMTRDPYTGPRGVISTMLVTLPQN